MNAASQNDHKGIILEQVSLTRDGRPALKNLSLTMTEHRIGLIGHNGSGKSSLARVLNGLLPVDSGSASVFGVNPSTGPEHMSQTVGFIFQNPDHQLILPTVIEELTFGLLNQGLTKTAAEERANKLLEEYSHRDWSNRPVHSLSEGQKQLVCIFAVILMRPRLLVLDEPFSALDLPTRYRLLQLIHSLPQQVVMISHDLDTLELFDRVVWLHGGQVHADGTPEQILPDYQRDARERAGERLSTETEGILP